MGNSEMQLAQRQQPEDIREKGLTFIEVMIVLIILGTIAALVGPAMFSKLDESNIRAAKLQMGGFDSALELYYLDNSAYPDVEQGLDALLHQPNTGREARNWRGPYLKKKKLPLDPWGTPYDYQYESGSFQLRSFGADGEEGGEGNDQDILHE